MYKYENLIKRLYNSNIREPNSECENLKDERDKLLREFMKNLDEQKKKELYKIVNIERTVRDIDNENEFTRGFKIAFKICLESMDK